MGKGLLFLAFAICLVAQAQPLDILGSILNPVEGLVNNVVSVVGGVVEVVVSLPDNLVGSQCSGTGGLLSKALTGLVESLGDTVEGLLDTVDSLLEAVVALLVSLIEALIGTIKSLLFGLTSCFDSVVSQPLLTVKRLEATAIYKVNRGKISKNLIVAFQPLQAILDGVVKELSGILGAVPCILDTVLVNFTTEAIKGIGEVLQCAVPLLGEVTSATKLVGETVTDVVGIVGKTLGSVLDCATKKAGLLDIGQVLTCLTGSVAASLEGVDGLLDKVVPIVQKVLRSVLQLAECELKVFAKGFKTLAAILNQLGQCVSSRGISVKIPTVTVVVPSFTIIAEKACVTIELQTSSALAAKSPIAELKVTIDKLVKTLEYICPAEIEVLVNKIVNKTQGSIDSIKEIVKNNNNPAVKNCVSKAQSDLDKLGPRSEKEIVSCSAAIGPDAAAVIAEAAELEVELKKEMINAPTEAYEKCDKLVFQSDKTIQSCFDKAISDSQNRIIELNRKINLATAKANALIEKDHKCLWGGLDDLEEKARAIVKELRDCLLSQNVILPSIDNTVIVQICAKSLRAYILELRPILGLLRALIKTIEGLLAFILRLVADILCKVIAPLLNTVGNILKSLLGPLGRNDKVSYCTGDREKLTKIGVESKNRADACVKTKKVLASEYALRAVTEERTVTTVIANAEVNAQVKCQGSVNVLNCYANFRSNLDVTVKQSKEKIQYYVSTVKLLVTESLSCVYTEETATAVIADNELQSIKGCLAKENINVLFKV